MIEVKGITKAFGEKKVIDDLSFSLKEREILGVYGKSGIGKTTLAKILCGLLPMDKGEIWLDGAVAQIILKDRQSPPNRGCCTNHFEG